MSRLILVDDNENNRLVVELGVLAAGIPQFVACASGAELFHWLDSTDGQREAALILLDLHMPHEDGFMVLQCLRRRGITARIVAISANVMDADVERCRRVGFDGFLGKPFQPQRFPLQLLRTLAGEAVWEPR